MKKIVIICLTFIIISVALSACTSHADFGSSDRSIVFTFDDIEDFDVEKYDVRTMRNGEDYLYTKSNTKMNGLSCMYRVVLIDSNKNEVTLNTSVNLQPEVERANDLFISNTKTMKALYSTSIKDISPEEYNADQLMVIDSENYFSIMLCKDNLFYRIDIDGLTVNEDQVKENLLQKIVVVLEKENSELISD